MFTVYCADLGHEKMMKDHIRTLSQAKSVYSYYVEQYGDYSAVILVDPQGNILKSNLEQNTQEEIPDPFDNCDYEIGYDPYLGCFSDDC